MLKFANVRRAWAGGCAALMLCVAPVMAESATALRYKWTQGEVLYYRSVQDTKGKMSMAQMGERETSQRQEIVQKVEVKDVAADGSATLDMSFVSVKIDADQGGGMKASYDSTKAPEAAAANEPPMAVMVRTTIESMGALVGEHVTVVVTSKGEVTKVEGMTKIVDKIQGKLGGANPRAAQNLKASMGDEAMKARLANVFLLPEKPVDSGETWVTTSELPIPSLGSRMKLEGTWSFAGTAPYEGAEATKLTCNLKIETAPVKEGEESGPMPGMKTNIKDGKGTGQLLFDNKAGKLLKSEMTQTLPIEMTMGGQGGQSFNIKNDMVAMYSFELIPAPKATEPAAAPANGDKK